VPTQLLRITECATARQPPRLAEHACSQGWVINWVLPAASA